MLMHNVMFKIVHVIRGILARHRWARVKSHKFNHALIFLLRTCVVSTAGSVILN
jgi:hypothetical protein